MIAARIALTIGLLAVGSSGCLQRNPDFIGATEGATTETGESAGPGGSADTQPGPSSTSPGGAESDTTDGSLGCAPNLDSLRLSVFADNCTADGCHAGDVPAAALDLASVDLYEDLLDVPSNTCLTWSRVVAEQPDQSILYAKVAGIATCEVDRPVPHDMLPSDQLDCLGGWIETIVACERCGGVDCIDLQADAANCGACGVACPAEVACVAGVCACPEGSDACGDACVDLQTDAQHCGGCGNDCQGSPCTDGACACAGLTECGGCVDTQTDSQHCGGCDQPCGFGRSCQEGSCGCSPTLVSLAADVQPIFTAHCVANGCHGGANPKKDLRLEDGASWAELVDVPAVECSDGRFRVQPGAPESSYLMDKLLGIDLCGGVQMPQSGGPGDDTLPNEDLDAVSAWICQGALDN